LRGEPGPSGSFVFYNKGKTAKGWRYLEGAPEDASSGIRWSNGTAIEVETGIDMCSGKGNTDATVKAQGSGSYAAQLCHKQSYGGFLGWFLPSTDELDLLYGVLGAKIRDANSHRAVG